MKKAADESREELPEGITGYPDRPADDVRKESNPFTERDWRMLGYAWSGFVLRLLLIAGGIFTVYQYVQTRDEARIGRTLEMVDLWEQPQYQEAQRAVRQRIAALNERYSRLIGENPSPEELRVYRSRIGMEAMSEDGGEMPLPDFEEHFDRIVYFLNRVAFCVESDMCKREVADAYFRDYAQSFWAYFEGHVDRRRTLGSPSFATAIERFIEADPQPFWTFW